MTDDRRDDAELQSVLDVLSDPECRAILAELEEPRNAQEVSARCGVSQTGAYRKLEALCEAGLLDEGTEMRPDGHHVTTYERVVTGVCVALEDDDFDFELVRDSATPDRRLAQFWTRISEEL